MAGEKHNIQGYEEKSSIQLAGQIVILGEKPGVEEPYLVANCKWDNPFGVYEYFNVSVTADYFEAVGEFIKRQSVLLEQLETEHKLSGIAFQALTEDDCIPNGKSEDITGKIIVIKPEVLSPEYRTMNHQIKLCTGGFGANPNASGRAVFCTDLYSGKSSRFERMDIAGVIDPEKMPEWAKTKLAEIQKAKENPKIAADGTFEYGGNHFTPYRKFEKRDGDFVKQTNRMSSDRRLGISRYEWQKVDYSHAKFYAASGGSDYDIFKCVENGKLYVPCDAELFQYTEPIQRNKTTQKKPTFQNKLENAKEKAEEQNTVNRNNHKSKGSGQVEVD